MTHTLDSIMALATALYQHPFDAEGRNASAIAALRLAISEVLAEMDEALLQQKAWADKWDHTNSRAEQAETECERLRKDAERYRWLRDKGDDTWNPLIKRTFGWNPDVAIDAAIAQEKT